MKVFNSGCMQSMITYTGFDYDSFNLLLELLEPKFHTLSHQWYYKKDNGWKGEAPLILGLVLAWSRSRGKFFTIIVIVFNSFIITITTCIFFYDL